MFNIGGMELVVIAVLALVVLGPDRLPEALRRLGSVVGEVRRISQSFQTDLSAAISSPDVELREAEPSSSGSSPT